MGDKLIYINNDDKQNSPFCRLKLLVESFDTSKKPTNQNSIKVPKVEYIVTYYKTLGTSLLYKFL